MSKLTSAHHQLSRMSVKLLHDEASTFGIDTDRDFEVNDRVERYHRDGSYREIIVSANNREYLRSVGKKLGEWAKDLGIYVIIELTGSARSKQESLLMVYMRKYEDKSTVDVRL